MGDLLPHLPRVRRCAQAILEENRFDIIKELGHGAYGVVNLVRSRRARPERPGRLFAAKVVECPNLAWDGKQVAEVHIHNILRQHGKSSCITRLLYVLPPPRAFPDTYAMLFELAEAGTFRNLISGYGRRVRYIPEAFLWSVLKDIAAALAHCARHGVAHKDIHAGNILLHSSGTSSTTQQYPRALLADFGSAKCENDPPPLQPPPPAPGDSSSGRDSSYGSSGDVWAVGRMLFHAAQQGLPAFDNDPPYFCDNCQERHPRKEERDDDEESWRALPPRYSEKLNQLLYRCQELEEEDRWSSQQLSRFLEAEAPQMIRTHFEELRPWALETME